MAPSLQQRKEKSMENYFSAITFHHFSPVNFQSLQSIRRSLTWSQMCGFYCRGVGETSVKKEALECLESSRGKVLRQVAVKYIPGGICELTIRLSYRLYFCTKAWGWNVHTEWTFYDWKHLCDVVRKTQSVRNLWFKHNRKTQPFKIWLLTLIVLRFQLLHASGCVIVTIKSDYFLLGVTWKFTIIYYET